MIENYPHLKYFLTFNGYGHSGHTVLAAMLASHPRVLISNTYGKRYSDNRAIHKLIKQAKGPDNRWNYNDHVLPGQTECDQLEVIGHTTVDHQYCPHELEHKRIATIRHPWDNLNAFEKPSKHVKKYKKVIEGIKPTDHIVYLEDLIKNPITTFGSVLTYLDLHYIKGWNPLSILWTEPRTHIMRQIPLGNDVRDIILTYDVMKRYR